MDKNTKKEVQTTGHEWDGIKEYNNPLPLWWLWIFVICVIFAIGYVIYFPAIPPLGQKFVSASGWTQYKKLEHQVGTGMKIREPFEAKIQNMSPEEIMQDPELYTYAKASGKSLFALHCAQCHGAGGGGAKGYPNHLDDEWIWGGSLSQILQTIRHGIRDSQDPNTRDMGPMMAFGDDELLTKEQINEVVYYVQKLAHPYLDSTPAVARGKVIFAENCASCHMDNGEGNRELGAPPLNNAVWLYGGKTADIIETITHGRAGMMPAYGARLPEEDLEKLALYVHSLGGGEEEPQPEPEMLPEIIQEDVIINETTSPESEVMMENIIEEQPVSTNNEITKAPLEMQADPKPEVMPEMTTTPSPTTVE